MDDGTTEAAGEARHAGGLIAHEGARKTLDRQPTSVRRHRARRAHHVEPGVGVGADRAEAADGAIEDRLTSLLDEAYEGLASHARRVPFSRLVDELAQLVAGVDAEVVRQRLRPRCTRHPLRDVLRQDPFTRHSEDRPRGYAGDADLIDFIYGVRAPGAEASGLGSEIFAQLMARPGPSSVRHRRALIAETIDAQADASQRPISVLSLACGHVREGFLSQAVAQGRARITAFDQDRRSVAAARRAFAGRAVDVAVGSVRQAIARKLTQERYDLVYSAGLYDYLADGTALRLTTRLFELVRPGGRLLIANFVPSCSERGYMETFMDWYLQYRTPEAFALVRNEIPAEHIEHERTFMDPDGQIVYLELTRH